ncbi:hypothetical protein D3C71_1383670 [compost metagenome]
MREQLVLELAPGAVRISQSSRLLPFALLIASEIVGPDRHAVRSRILHIVQQPAGILQIEDQHILMGNPTVEIRDKRGIVLLDRRILLKIVCSRQHLKPLRQAQLAEIAPNIVRAVQNAVKDRLIQVNMLQLFWRRHVHNDGYQKYRNRKA